MKNHLLIRGDNILKYINQMRVYRSLARYPQKELAADLGVSVMTLRNYESGETVPDVYTAFKIAHLISVYPKASQDVSIGDIFRVVEIPDSI